jgi:hypothetical protein
MDVESDGINSRFYQGHGTADNYTASHDITYSESDSEVDSCETDGLNHDIVLSEIQNICLFENNYH